MRCYIVATGSSLQGFGFTGLQKYDCIAVNAAFRLVPWFKHLVAVDREFYLNNLSSLKSHIGKLHCIELYSDDPVKDELRVNKWQSRKPVGYDEYPYVCHGYNSAYTAINISIHLGYTDIRLLGFDAGETYIDGSPVTGNGYEHLIKKCRILKKELPGKITITNYSMGSRIEAFNKRPLSEWDQ